LRVTLGRFDHVVHSGARIQGQDYTFNSDVWSMGVTILECAQGRFPFSKKWRSQTSVEAAPADHDSRPSETPPAASDPGTSDSEPSPLIRRSSDMLFWDMLEIDERSYSTQGLPRDLSDFINLCLMRSADERPTATELSVRIGH